MGSLGALRTDLHQTLQKPSRKYIESICQLVTSSFLNLVIKILFCTIVSALRCCNFIILSMFSISIYTLLCSCYCYFCALLVVYCCMVVCFHRCCYCIIAVISLALCCSAMLLYQIILLVCM
jgi:hypothetical protein